MDDVIRMYAMSDGGSEGEPQELDPDQVDDFEDEEEIGAVGFLTTSDDDEGIVEETVVVVEEPVAAAPLVTAPAPKKAPAKKAPAKKAAKKAAAKKAAAKKAPASCGQKGRKEVRRQKDHWRQGRKDRSQKGCGQKRR